MKGGLSSNVVCEGVFVDAFDVVSNLLNLIGTGARLLVSTRGGRSLLLVAIAALPLIEVATKR